ncbi:hypothetical protein CLOM_g8874 [Closterium sp. NIES-68]|nr:hypothetical protein CLOM_g14975 [Closterium sp. NIES-68]GJP49692.1 hypothetical protein CLOM_g8874 [Closterium sp. NIES-68]GJP74214.1 hypothetical protein CLOP_g4836 [Closterium sp. NIES-67]
MIPSKGNSFAEYGEKPSSRRPGLLKNQLRLVRRVMPDGKARKEIAPVEEKLSFEKGFFLFIRAVQLLTQNNPGVILVGLAGPSGAGKTAFTCKVAGFMPSIAVISMDNYNVASRVIDGNFDDPRITDYELLLENIEGLRRGEAVQVPMYDFKTSQRVGFREQPVPKSRVIIIEGIHALNERLRPLLDLRVSITGGVHFDLVKRVLRDIDRSGQAPESIIQQISETVYPMYKAFIEPELKTAHIRMVNNFNPFSGFQDATYLLKSPAEGEGWEERVKAVVVGEQSREEVETYEIYLLPPGEDKDTCQSYLRMRNRDGRYSLMFEEWVTDGPFIITPRITFSVSVRLLGGLMALGYEIAHIVHRESVVFREQGDASSALTVKLDRIEQLKATYVQVIGKDRKRVKDVAEQLGMDGKYISHPYIEDIKLHHLTQEIQSNQPAPLSSNVLKQRLRISDDILPFSPPVGPHLASPSSPAAASSSWSAGARKLDKTKSLISMGQGDPSPDSMPAPTAALAKAEITTMRSACSATALELLKLEEGRRGGGGGGGGGGEEEGQGSERGEGRQAVNASQAANSRDHVNGHANGHVNGSGSSHRGVTRNHRQQQTQQEGQQQLPETLSASTVAEMLCSNQSVEHKLTTIADQIDRLLLRMDQNIQTSTAHGSNMAGSANSNPPATSAKSNANCRSPVTPRGFGGGEDGLQRDVSAVAEQQRLMALEIQSLCTLLQEAQRPSSPPRTSYWRAAFSFACLSSNNYSTSSSSGSGGNSVKGQWVSSALIALAVGTASFAGTSLLLSRKTAN